MQERKRGRKKNLCRAKNTEIVAVKNVCSAVKTEKINYKSGVVRGVRDGKAWKEGAKKALAKANKFAIKVELFFASHTPSTRHKSYASQN